MVRRWEEMRWTEELGTHPAIGGCTSERFVAKEGTCAASTGEEGVGFCLRRREKKGRGVEKGLEVVGGRGQRAFKGCALLRGLSWTDEQAEKTGHGVCVLDPPVLEGASQGSLLEDGKRGRAWSGTRRGDGAERATACSKSSTRTSTRATSKSL